jgi:stress response protein YsnF
MDMDMTTTIIGTAETHDHGRKLVAELVAAGLPDQDINVLEGKGEKIMNEIIERGFDEETASGFVEALESGRVLIAARTAPEQLDKAVAIMKSYETSDVVAGEQKLVEVEEELSVGKHKVAQGGVRVTNRVTETPVEQTVTLRTETVETGRQSVERKLSAQEAADAFKEKTVELVGTTEEVDVTKEAHVVGEVSLGKRVEEREQKVQDTVRRTHVDVEQIKPGAAARR